MVAIAVNCDVLPTIGGAPATVIDETVADGEVEELHPITNTASPITATNEVNRRSMTFLLCDSQALQHVARWRGSNHCAIL
jgi:hypothetical protein